jgi:hypothetical protein
MIRNNFNAVMMICLFSGCIEARQGYYLSPANANSNPYHPIPLKSDSVRNAIYTNLVYTIGSANDQGFDQVSVIQAGAHRSQNFGCFQAYYGVNLSLGSYNIAGYYNAHYHEESGLFGGYPVPDDTIYHIHDKGEFFGTYGVSGGVNVVIKARDGRGEWRALGYETSVQNEFGNYAEFRKKLPDSAANIIFKNTLSATIGLYTDFIWKTPRGMVGGFKFAGGLMINPATNYIRKPTDDFINGGSRSNDFFPITYFSSTFHMSKGHYTGFIQLNFGTYADSFQSGLSYRLGKK